MNLTSKILFPGAAWWLWVLVPLVFLGFLPSYFSKPIAGTSGLLHAHAFLMLIWLALALVQPLLIVYKKARLHRALGKLSYVVMPLLLVSGWLVIRGSYSGMVTVAAETTPDPGQVDTANQTIFIPVLFLFWLALFYVLAIANRKRVLPHATYILAAVLTLIGPSFDRVLFQVYKIFGINFNWFAEYAVFIILDLVLLLVLYTQWRHRLYLKPILLTIGIYAAGQVAYEVLPGSKIWGWLLWMVM